VRLAFCVSRFTSHFSRFPSHVSHNVLRVPTSPLDA
jgi:hypothetical protein